MCIRDRNMAVLRYLIEQSNPVFRDINRTLITVIKQIQKGAQSQRIYRPTPWISGKLRIAEHFVALFKMRLITQPGVIIGKAEKVAVMSQFFLFRRRNLNLPAIIFKITQRITGNFSAQQYIACLLYTSNRSNSLFARSHSGCANITET